MKRKMYSGFGLLVLLVGFLAFNLLNSNLFHSVRLDLTENRLFTLAEGSKQVVDEISSPIDLHFFFSEKITQDLPQLQNYARQVRSLLQEYTLYADGKINLHIIDPEPFSEAEDQAAVFGLQAVPLNMAGDQLYFGLAGTSMAKSAEAAEERETVQEVISFFQEDQERFLEYEITKLIYRLAHPEPPVVGIISGLDIQGGYDMRAQQPTPPWQIYRQINQLYQTRLLNNQIEQIADDISLLMLIQPGELSEQTLYAIDQFVLAGGKLIFFLDPLAELDRPPRPYQVSNGLKKLLDSWGVEFTGQVVTDAGNALMVANAQGRPVRHLSILGLDADSMLAEDVATGSLEKVNLSSAGIIEPLADATTQFTPLLYSSKEAMPMVPEMVQAAFSPEMLQQSFNATGERFTLAARVAGKALSAFDGPPEKDEKEQKDDKGMDVQDSELDRSVLTLSSTTHIRDSADINILVVADTDLLSDRLWVQVQNFFGQQVVTPFADNAGFVINALDNFSGSSALISVRSRGRFFRPFTVVEQLRRQAEERFRDKEKQLQERLQQTEVKLAELEQQKAEGSATLLSPEQEAELVSFQQEKLGIRKQLREVRHQLDKDIETLGTQIKMINIALIHLLLVIGALVLRRIRRRVS